MKKFATLAVLAAISGGAYAQSVTLFGIIDEAARYVKNGDLKQKSLVSGGINTSRLGVRGTEDLGGGLTAGFWLETGLNADSGTQSDPTRFWNRRSTVSLIGSFGELRLGRDFTPTYTGYSDYDAFGDNGVAASGKFDSSLGTARDTGTRADNQIMYLTPANLGGFYGRAAVAAGEGTAGKKYIGARAGYAAGPLDVSAAYGQTTVAPLPLGGEDKFKTADIGASYDFGVVKATGYYTQSKFAAQKIASYSIGAIVPVGLGQIKAAYTHANASGTDALGVNVDANDANQFALGYIYNLSKRTAVYGTGAYIKNKGNATFAVASAPTLVPGGKSTGLELGLRHSF
ncbi:MAG TPA: porin [Burkholderiaceae bacterium]|nr:porin [Burkholderiaceae bacterium]